MGYGMAARERERASSLVAEVVAVADLGGRRRDALWALFARYYDRVDRARFERDLDAKDEVIVVTDPAGEIVGFSTLVVETMAIDGRPISLVFSGDTVVDRAHWGSQTFAFAWIRRLGAIAAASPLPAYWLLIVKGHRTYRYLPAFAVDFVPDWRGGDDPALVRLRDAVAIRRFGDAYDPATGLLRAAPGDGRLAPRWAEVTPREAARPDVRFFLERNPGHAEGDELVCLCPIDPANMRPLTRRLFLDGAVA